MGNFGYRLQQFMAGRHGMDALNRFIVIVALIIMVLEWIFPLSVLRVASLLVVALFIFRMLSRNQQTRYKENDRYLKVTQGIRSKYQRYKTRHSQKKFYCFFKCPECKQQVRVPKGKGKINIRCPKCNHTFTKKS